MSFVFPTEQRVLTSDEYAQLGYVLQGDLSKVDLKTTADKPLSSGYSLPAYRADSKEEFGIDLAMGIVKVGYALSTGGLSAAVNTTLGYTFSLFT